MVTSVCPKDWIIEIDNQNHINWKSSSNQGVFINILRSMIFSDYGFYATKEIIGVKTDFLQDNVCKLSNYKITGRIRQSLCNFFWNRTMKSVIFYDFNVLQNQNCVCVWCLCLYVMWVCVCVKCVTVLRDKTH